MYNISKLVVADADDDDAEVQFEESTFAFLFNVVINGCLSVVGICCNILAIIVLQLDRHKLSMTVLLQGLAASDILFLVYTLLYTTLRSVYPYTGHLEWAHREASPYIVTYVLPCGWIAQTTSIWLVVLVTADRYHYVCHPFLATRWCTVHRSRSLVAATWLVAILFNTPRFFYYHHMSFGSPYTTNTTATFVAHTDSGTDSWDTYRLVYHIALTLTLLFVIPLPVLIFLNARLMSAISGARRRTLQLGGSHREKDSLGVTTNLVVIVTIFILCETPDFMASIIKLDAFSGSMNSSHMNHFLCVRETLLVFSATVNFWVYCVFYGKFRRLLRYILCWCCVSRDSLVVSSTDYGVGGDSGTESTLIFRTNRQTN